MTYVGRVSEGKVILPPEAHLPEGVEVEVTARPILPQVSTVEGSPQGALTWAEVLGGVIGTVEGPPDLAANHDYYAHGAPKGIDRE